LVHPPGEGDQHEPEWIQCSWHSFVHYRRYQRWTGKPRWIQADPISGPNDLAKSDYLGGSTSHVRFPNLQEAWQHSLQVADLSEQLARQSGTIDPGEAYLAGLVHNVGTNCAARHAAQRIRADSGVGTWRLPPQCMPSLLLRTDHAALGAQIAAGWLLPEALVSGIQHHHRPENTDSSCVEASGKNTG
jgi:HD-like signal output (HDOD) protein